MRSRCCLVPVEGFEVIPHELLVEAWRAGAEAPVRDRPETGTVGRQDLVDQKQMTLFVKSEFELGVGDDDSAIARPGSRTAVDRQRNIANPQGQLRADERLG